MATSDVHEIAYLFQRFSDAVQQFNRVFRTFFGATVYYDGNYISFDFVCACMFYLFDILLKFLHL